MLNKLNYIDLFAGAGGLSEGFTRQGYNPIAHIEMNVNACETLKTRSVFHYLQKENKLDIYSEYLKGNIDRNILWNSVPKWVIDSTINKEISEATVEDLFIEVDKLKQAKKIDLIIGGPPCQAYSIVGRARDPQHMRGDMRNYLYKYYLKFLNKYQPEMFVFENVPGLLTAKSGEYFRNIIKGIEDAGYKVNYKILLASNYRVLQNRKRVIIIGWKKGTNHIYPNIQVYDNPYQVLKDLFYDLPKRKPGEGKLREKVEYIDILNNYLKSTGIRGVLNFTTQHIARPQNKTDLKIYKLAIAMWLDRKQRLNYAKLDPKLQKHNNKKSFLNRFQVVNNDGCCHTVVAHIAMDGHYYIYPSLEQVRSITIREAARLQSFPDDYFFEGSRTSAFKQIGNAVPVLLAEEIAKAIKKQF
ncbi:MAG: DNA cytosine methyltransferase [Bacteroidales bacterium]